MSQIIVTGAGGQLGQTLKKLFPSHYFLNSTELDITNELEVKTKLGKLLPGSVVINCAAYTSVDLAEEQKELAARVNVVGVENLGRACLEYGLRLLHVSTDYVFDGQKNVPYCETDKTNPIGEYGQTKLLGERRLAEILSDYCIVRTSWVYSEFGNNFLKTMLKLKERESLNVVFDQVGSPTYTDDLAMVLMKIAESFDSHKGEIYHFSNEGVCSWYDFAREIMEMVGVSCIVNPIESHEYPTKTKRPHYSVLNKKKIKKALNIQIPHWKESLEKCLKNISL